jgi:hypothetical protein
LGFFHEPPSPHPQPCAERLQLRVKNGATSEITIQGKKAARGERMTKGTGWRLAKVSGRKRIFVGTLKETINMGSRRIAIFSVPK